MAPLNTVRNSRDFAGFFRDSAGLSGESSGLRRTLPARFFQKRKIKLKRALAVSILAFQQLTECTLRRHRPCACTCCFSVCSQSDTEYSLDSPYTHSGSQQALSLGSSQQRVFRNKNNHTVILQAYMAAEPFRGRTGDPWRSAVLSNGGTSGRRFAQGSEAWASRQRCAQVGKC